jgi:PAS domain S-box-containing protein
LRFQAKLLNVIGQAVIVTDPAGTVTWINRAAEDLYGWSEKETVGRDILDVTVPQMSHKQAEDIMAQLSKDKSWSGDFLVQHRDGTIFPAQVDNSVIRDDEGRVIGIIGISSDITGRKQAEETIQHYADDLEYRVQERTIELTHANRAKDEFLTMMSHELRTPLNSILGLSESVLEQRLGPLNEKQEKYVNLVQSSGQHLLSLINDILEVSKIEAGKLELRPDIISVKEVCESSLNFIKEMAVKKSISVEFRNPSSIDSLRADPQRLKQILVNLLNNAVKFTPERGKASLEVHLNTEKDQIQFSVTDTGIGIAHENLSKIFDPFSQIDSSLSRQYEGTGLGLALVMKLTELHGGSVQVESTLGKGSCFTIVLPWNKTYVIKDGQDKDLAAKNEYDKEPARITGEHITVLLAEDNQANALTIHVYLSDYGFEVLVAHNGIEAVKMAEESSPHIILMDIQMPAMDGLEATRRLRENPRFASTPIIALTALAMPGDRERCREAGANEYMSKPVSLKGLLNTIHKLLE